MQLRKNIYFCLACGVLLDNGVQPPGYKPNIVLSFPCNFFWKLYNYNVANTLTELSVFAFGFHNFMKMFCDIKVRMHNIPKVDEVEIS